MLLRILIFLIFSVFYAHKISAHQYLDDITITSDKVDIDKNTNVIHFSGKVIIYAQNVIIKTTKIIIHINNDNGKRFVNFVEMPHKLSATRDNNGLIDVIVADSAKWDRQTKIIDFYGKVYLQHNDRVVGCDHLSYKIKIEMINTHE